jgi:drug/metabolite transporter (DMT)-like permease
MISMERKSIIQMTLCAVLWSIAGLFIKLVPWNGMVIAGVRSLICAAVFILYMAVTRRRFVFTRATLRLALTIPATSLCFMMANKMTTAANAIVLQYVAPVFLIAYESVFHHKRFRKGDYVAVLCTMAGVALFFLDQLKGGAVVGNILAVLAGAFFAATMFTIGGVNEEGRMSGLLQGHLMTALIGLPFLFVYGAQPTPTALIAILVLGVLQLGIPYILYGLAAGGCTPLALTLIAALEPILNPLWVFLFIGEAPGRTALFGGLLVIVSVTLWCVWDVKTKGTAGVAAEASAHP